ncbi:AaceriADL277Wp [[Ashbya] aceris (nom. inval.)]|nr:AaceriADL277Wp [[Ashbya] aceris (nom. inval.)]
MGKVSKATKKFQSKHLKHTLDHRKQIKEHNKKIQGRRGNKSEDEKRALALSKEEQKMRKSTKEEVFKDMSVEKFFEGGFELPKADKKLKQAAQKAKDDDDESSEEEDMEQNMAELAEKDPEFYKYLQENDKDLLGFGASNPLDAMSDDDEEEGQSTHENGGQEGDEKVLVSYKLVSQWKKGLAENPSPKLIRNVCSAFKAAVNANQDSAAELYKFAVTDEKAFHELMFVALKDIPQAVQKLAPYKVNKGMRTLPSNSTVSRLSSIMKSHAGSLLTLLHDITNTDTAVLVLHSTDQLLPYFVSYRKVLKEIVSAIAEVWSTTQDVETQAAAFAFITNAAREFKKSLLELVLKTTYSSFIKFCRKTNVHTMHLINFQKNSAAALFGIDATVSYNIGFEYIRQLAIHLRNSINATTKKTANSSPADAYKIVYNWQFCHSLDFWSRVLALQCSPENDRAQDSALRQLIYPLVQVTLGTLRLIPTAQFFPLRFYLTRSLLRISQHTGVYIPIYPLLSEILSSTAFTKAAKKSTLAAFDFDHNIKCNKAYLGTKIYQNGLIEQFTELLAEFYVIYAKNISFPELISPAVVALRRYIKSSKNMKFNKMLSVVIEKLNQNADFILDKRAGVDFGPNNKAEVDRFLADLPWDATPLGKYVSVQREIKEERARIMRESLAEDDKKSDDEGDLSIPDAPSSEED